MFMFNGFFTVCQTWIIFFIFNKSEKHVKNKQIKHENDNKLIPKIEKEKNIISTHKTVPDETDNVYIGEEISLDDVLAVSGNISYYRIIDILNACISDNQTEAIVLLDKTLKE